MTNKTQELIELADLYANAQATYKLEDLYGTSKGYTAECKSFADEARSKLLDALEAQALDLDVQAAAPVAAQPVNAGLVEALEEAKRWHQGDKWRDGDMPQRAAWEEHMSLLDTALSQAGATEGRQIYLIESYFRSPIYIAHPKPVGYVQTLKEAKKICELKNKMAVRNAYTYSKLKKLK